MSVQDPSIPSPVGSFRRRVLQTLAIQLYRRPFLSILFLTAFTAIAAWHAFNTLEVREDLQAFLPTATENRKAWDSINFVTPKNDPIAIVLKFPADRPAPDERKRNDVARVFTDALLDETYFSTIELLPPDPDAGQRQTPTYREMLLRLRPDDLDQIKSLESPAKTDEAMGNALIRTITELKRMGEEPGLDLDSNSLGALTLSDPLGLFRKLSERRLPAYSHLLPPTVACTTPPRQDDRTIILVLSPKQSSSKLFFCVALHDFLSKTVGVIEISDQILSTGVTVSLKGRHIDTAMRAAVWRKDLLRITLFSILCLALLMILAFRKVESLFFVGLPPCVALIWTYGIISWIRPDINFLSAIFPFVIIAMGLEFSIQIYHRFIEELYREQRYYPALGLAYTEAGRGIVVTAIMTAAVFFSLYISDFTNLRELAVVCGISIVCMALSPLLILPPLAAIKSRLARGRVTPVNTYHFGLHQLGIAVTASPRTTLTLGLLITAYLAYFTQNIELNYQIGLDLRTDAKPLAEQQASFFSESKTISILIEGANLQEALGQNDQLYDNLLFRLPNLSKPMQLASICSVSPILPALATQTNVVKVERGALDIDAIEANLKAFASRSELLSADAFDPFVATLRGLQESAADLRPITIADLNNPADRDFVQSLIHDKADGVCRIITTVTPAPGHEALLTTRFAEFRKEATDKIPTSPRFDSELLQKMRVSRNVIFTVALMVLLSGLWLIICIIPHFHGQLLDAALALLPLVCASIWTFGFLAQLKTQVGLYALLIIPLIMGITVNQAILFTQRFHDRQYSSLLCTVQTGARSAVVSSLALVIGLSGLLQVRLPALQEMATIAVIAIIFSTLCTLLLLPALLQIREEGGLSAWSALNEDV